MLKVRKYQHLTARAAHPAKPWIQISVHLPKVLPRLVRKSACFFWSCSDFHFLTPSPFSPFHAFSLLPLHPLTFFQLFILLPLHLFTVSRAYFASVHIVHVFLCVRVHMFTISPSQYIPLAALFALLPVHLF